MGQAYLRNLTEKGNGWNHLSIFCECLGTESQKMDVEVANSKTGSQSDGAPLKASSPIRSAEDGKTVFGLKHRIAKHRSQDRKQGLG
jgi:hypothetical protein